MHWLISQFPELDHLEPAQRAQVLRQVPWWTYPLIVGLAVIPGLLAGGIAARMALDALRSSTAALVGIPVAAVVAAGLYGVQLWRIRSVMRRAIAQGFRGQGMPFCFECGYDLRNLAGPNCPECGNPADRQRESRP